MNFEALATDYDDTLAQFGRTDAPTLQALQRAKQSGRKLRGSVCRREMCVVEVAHLLLAGGLRRSQRVTRGTVSPESGRGSAR